MVMVCHPAYSVYQSAVYRFVYNCIVLSSLRYVYTGNGVLVDETYTLQDMQVLFMVES